MPGHPAGPGVYTTGFSIWGDPANPMFEATATHFVTVVPDEPGRDADALAVEPTTWGAI